MDLSFNSNRICRGVASIAMLASSLYMWGMPAKRGVMVPPPNHNSLTIRLVGDEHFHVYLTEDGYPLVADGNKFYYADITEDLELRSTGVEARGASARGAADKAALANDTRSLLPALFNKNAANSDAFGLRRASANLGDNSRFLYRTFPTLGDQKALVLLVEYPDVPFTLEDPHDYFYRMLNEPGFSTRGATGSASDFFLESSGGKFNPQFDVYGPVKLKHERAYYGGGSNDENAWEMVIEACDQLDDVIDFTQYDRDCNGYVDNIYVFFAGEGESSSGIPETVWPHASDITKIDLINTHVYDGKIVGCYGVSNEWENGNPDGVGTFCHEFSHVMGLPDLYPTAYSEAFDPGEWSALAYGPYNNEGRTPPLYSSFEKFSVGWLDLEELPEKSNITLPPAGTGKAYAIKTSNSDEFYILENRQQVSWDKYLPHHGMLVWHIDYSKQEWDRNAVNNNAKHQRVDIVEADNVQTMETYSGDPFPGTAGITSFTDDTTPSMMSWLGYRISRPLTGIAENEDGFITFKVSGGYDDIASPVGIRLVGGTKSHKATIAWEPVDGVQEYLVSVYNANTFLPLEGIQPFVVKDATSCTFEGLTPSRSYHCYVQAVNGNVQSAPSRLLTFTTTEPGFEDIIPVANEASDITSDGFTASWQGVTEADGYLLNVYTKYEGEPMTYTLDFTDGVNPLPDGWTSTSKASYSLSGYAGASVPSLRLSGNGDEITSPDYADGVRTLTFWHRGNGSKTTSNFVTVMAKSDADEWTEVAKHQVVKDAGGKTITINNFPEDTKAVRIMYQATESGSLAIDDIVVGHGARMEREYVAGYQELAVGASSSFKVDKLQPKTDYFFTVRAAKGNLRSHESNEISLRTKEFSTIGEIDGETLSVSVIDNLLTVRGAKAGDSFIVTDLPGRIIVSGRADDNGQMQAELPHAGVYIVRVGNRSLKIIIK